MFCRTYSTRISSIAPAASVAAALARWRWWSWTVSAVRRRPSCRVCGDRSTVGRRPAETLSCRPVTGWVDGWGCLSTFSRNELDLSHTTTTTEHSPHCTVSTVTTENSVCAVFCCFFIFFCAAYANKRVRVCSGLTHHSTARRHHRLTHI